MMLQGQAEMDRVTRVKSATATLLLCCECQGCVRQNKFKVGLNFTIGCFLQDREPVCKQRHGCAALPCIACKTPQPGMCMSCNHVHCSNETHTYMEGQPPTPSQA